MAASPKLAPPEPTAPAPRKRAPKPVYVHCMDGLDRTGVLIAAYRVLVENVDSETAIAEVRRYGTPWIRVDARYIRSLSGERRDAILRLLATKADG